MKIGDKVYGIYNEWIDHPYNFFVVHDYSGKIVKIEDNQITVKSKTLGIIVIITTENDTINNKSDMIN
jgi:hypothetical protein